MHHRYDDISLFSGLNIQKGWKTSHRAVLRCACILNTVFESRHFNRDGGLLRNMTMKRNNHRVKERIRQEIFALHAQRENINMYFVRNLHKTEHEHPFQSYYYSFSLVQKDTHSAHSIYFKAILLAKFTLQHENGLEFESLIYISISHLLCNNGCRKSSPFTRFNGKNDHVLLIMIIYLKHVKNIMSCMVCMYM